MKSGLPRGSPDIVLNRPLDYPTLGLGPFRAVSAPRPYGPLRLYADTSIILPLPQRSQAVRPALLLRPGRDLLPRQIFVDGLRSCLITAPVPLLQFPQTPALQVFAQGSGDQRRPIHTHSLLHRSLSQISTEIYPINPSTYRPPCQQRPVAVLSPLPWQPQPKPPRIVGIRNPPPDPARKPAESHPPKTRPAPASTPSPSSYTARTPRSSPPSNRTTSIPATPKEPSRPPSSASS
jgi:hypothetical protein